ncbi:hypothetical protein [Sphingobium chungbukense]|uniref:Uncharacterized protein n=1 Tax=Sphingobium chungbukense TaxID=56193 RepID=A0A0M3AVA8_9SPHN|nr:hypothetical protein [Sphingobium chungbukense]KKW93863.1 hypothetical protein YP76_04175 [Sphingobium chungbukense]
MSFQYFAGQVRGLRGPGLTPADLATLDARVAEAEAEADRANGEADRALGYRDQVADFVAMQALPNTFNTKALANSALSGIADGTYVQVVDDESRSHFRSLYIVQTGAYVFVSYLTSTPALGVAADAADLGAFTGTIIPDNQTAKQALQAIETFIASILTGGVAFALPDEADGDVIPAPGSGRPYLSAGVLKIA